MLLLLLLVLSRVAGEFGADTVRSVEGGWLENGAEGEEVWAWGVGDERASHCECVFLVL